MGAFERKYLSPKEISEKFGIPQGTLTQWRHLGKGPAYFKLGRKVRYALDDFEEWLKHQRILTSDALELSSRSR